MRGTALKWIKSYLTGRVQCVQVEDSVSTCLDFSCGVPQGSVLGPKLFILYINDIVKVSDVLKLILFADDTNILCSGTDLNQLVNLVNHEMSKLHMWFNINKLSLNLLKTKFILFGKRGLNKSINLNVDDTMIERVNEHKILGVTVDCLLTWKPHVKQIQGKIAKSVSILWKTQKLLNLPSLKTIYTALITPHMQYCAEVWGHSYKGTLEPLVKLQKKALRIIYRVPYQAHTNDLFIKARFLKLHDIIKYNTLQLLFAASNNVLPTNIQNLFLLRDETLNLRGSIIYKQKLVHSTLRGHSLSIVGVKLWNSLNVEIKLSTNLKVFKHKIKCNMIEDYQA